MNNMFKNKREFEMVKDKLSSCLDLSGSCLPKTSEKNEAIQAFFDTIDLIIENAKDMPNDSMSDQSKKVITNVIGQAIRENNDNIDVDTFEKTITKLQLENIDIWPDFRDNAFLIELVKSENYLLADHIIDKGINIEVMGLDSVEGSMNQSILHIAAYKNNSFLINKVMEKASHNFINHQDKEGRTPILFISSRDNCNEALSTLLSYDPNLTIEDNHGNNVIKLAKNSSVKNFETIKSYLENRTMKKKFGSSLSDKRKNRPL